MKTIKSFLYRHIKILWILFTAIILGLALLVNWDLSIKRSQNDLTEISNDLSNNMDGFIEDVFQEVYTLPAYGKDLTNCKADLYPSLQHITLNNPLISGITISSDQNLNCSTLPDLSSLKIPKTKRRTLIGPYRLSLFDQSIYHLQQRIGNFNVGIILVESALKKILKAEKEKSSSLALYNKQQKQNIIRVEYSEAHKAWVTSADKEAQSPINSKYMFASQNLQSINGLAVVVFENHRTLLLNLLYSQILVTLLVIFISTLLYFLFINMLKNRSSLNTVMKLALKNNAFYPIYQPVYDCILHKYTGVEVLLRWKDHENQIIMPDFFIEEAERTGLIVPITLHIIEIAFKELNELLKQYEYFHIAVNISAIHFTDPVFFNKFKLLLTQYDIRPKQIIFEITERDLIDTNNRMFTKHMKDLRDAGHYLAVDDYGTGHASINYLNNLPFDYLKIDKIFVQAIGTKAITESLNEAIIQMAKGLNLIIIAEGVETAAQVKYLSENGVRLLQGWYFSRGISCEELTQLIDKENK